MGVIIHGKKLVEYGFRLPAAMDNRPLKMEEFEGLIDQTVFVSATPADYELKNVKACLWNSLSGPQDLLIQ